MVFAAIGNTCHYYWDNIPSDTAGTVARSALYSFTAAIVIASDYNKRGTSVSLALARPLKAAAMAACASLVHALITPLFNCIFGDNEITFARESMKRYLAASIVVLSIEHATASKVAFTMNDFLTFLPVSVITSGLKLFAETMDYMFPIPPSFVAGLHAWGLYPQAGTNSSYLYC